MHIAYVCGTHRIILLHIITTSSPHHTRVPCQYIVGEMQILSNLYKLHWSDSHYIRVNHTTWEWFTLYQSEAIRNLISFHFSLNNWHGAHVVWHDEDKVEYAYQHYHKVCQTCACKNTNDAYIPYEFTIISTNNKARNHKAHIYKRT